MFLAVYMDETVYAQTPLLIVLFSRPCYTICKVARPLPAVPSGLGFGSFFILYFGGECVNIKEIAQLAGVSVATISRVLNHPEQVRRKPGSGCWPAWRPTDYTPNWFARGLNGAHQYHCPAFAKHPKLPLPAHLLRSGNRGTQQAIRGAFLPPPWGSALECVI